MQERLVVLDAQPRWVSWNALGLKCSGSRFLDHRWKILARRFVADLSVGLACDEAQIGDIVRISACVAVLELGLGKDMMKLEPMLRARMVKRDSNLRPPVLGAARTKREEHGLE